jgi:hypothetical protein
MMSGTPFHLDVATGRYFFTKVQDAEVDRNMIVRAEDVREFVCADLRIELPKIIWIRPAPPTSKSGPLKQNYQEDWTPLLDYETTPLGALPRPTTPYGIRSDLTARPALEYAVAHELRHVWQKKHCRDVFQDECRAEGDAYPYGYEVLKRYLESRGGLSTELREEIDEKRARAGAVYRDRWPAGTFEAVQCDPP